MTMKCHKCGSNRVGRIQYGMPAFDEALERKIREEKIYLGGCCISGNDPKWHCFACKKNFGKPAVIREKEAVVPYAEAITSISFECGGFFGGYQMVTMAKSDKGIFVSAIANSYEDHEGIQRKATDREWSGVIKKLYEELCIHEWKRKYVDNDILDGTQWSLRIKLTGGRERHYYGSNEFPILWDELTAVFKPFLEDAEKKMQQAR